MLWGYYGDLRASHAQPMGVERRGDDGGSLHGKIASCVRGQSCMGGGSRACDGMGGVTQLQGLVTCRLGRGRVRTDVQTLGRVGVGGQTRIGFRLLR